MKRVLRRIVGLVRSLLGTDGLAAGVIELQAAVAAGFAAAARPDPAPAPPPVAEAAEWPVPLPPDMRTLAIGGRGARRPGFRLVLQAEPGRYDRIQIEHRDYSDIALLLALILDGAGTLIDVGANIGTIALPVAASGSRVLAVEMLPANAVRLQMAVLINGLPRVMVVNAAASAADGTLRHGGSEAWASVVAGAGPEAMALRLDTLVRSVAGHSPDFLRPPFALKVDVEGHDWEALLGAQRVLAAFRPVVLFESIQLDHVVENTRRCKEMLAASGFRLFMLRDRILVPKTPADVQEELVGDFVAVPEEAMAAFGARIAPFTIRAPSSAERLRWLESLRADTRDHQVHALRVIAALGRDDPAFADLAAGLRAALQAGLAPAAR